MMTKTELSKQKFIERLKTEISPLAKDMGCDMYQPHMESYNNGIKFAIDFAEQLSDTSELKAENEVLKLALELIRKYDVCEFCQGKAHYYNQKVDVDYILNQARQQIEEGKK